MSQASVQLVKYQKNEVKVEIMCKPGMVTKFRDGKCGMNDVLIDDRIYTNSSKGEVASEADIRKIAANSHEALEIILKTGKYSLTAQEKREETEKLRLATINYIHENFVDSTTGRPHPVTRIESAIAEIKGRIDPDKDAEANARSMIPKLQTVIRLQESQISGVLQIPNSKMGQCIGICYNLGKVTREEFGPEHAYISMILTPGQYDQFNDQISRASGGEAIFKIDGAAATSEENGPKEETKVRKAKGKPQGKGGKKGK